jgi:dTDP-4-amino-4,6-dideoxy-D-galactose acyltransferase
MDKILLHPVSKFYAPYNFLTNSSDSVNEWYEELVRAVDTEELLLFGTDNGVEIYYRYLKWDSEFFNVPTYRIDYTYIPDSVKNSKESFDSIFTHLKLLHPEFYLFAEVPSEDIQSLTSMTAAGYSLIESRLTYFNDQIQKFEAGRRYATRQANVDDIDALNEVAAGAVNIYDRFHADDFFTSEEADKFLAKYTENSVHGFADEVMVPADGPANAFLTANYLESSRCMENKKLAKMVLSAVSLERRGWYVKLISEMTIKFKEKGVDLAFMTTQSTNRAVLKVWASFGYRFGKSSHILSKYSRNR